MLQYLQSFIKDNERKIELAKKRLEMQEKNPELEAKVRLIYDYPSYHAVQVDFVNKFIIPVMHHQF